MKIQIKSIFGKILIEGDFDGIKQAVLEHLKSGADLRGAYLCGANLRGANLRDANLCGADLRDANLWDANLCGADLRDVKIKSIKVFSGLYRYTIYSILAIDGKRYVKMGCLFKSLEDWDKVGILDSNLRGFPNDGSRKSIERKEAFDFAVNAAKNLE